MAASGLLLDIDVFKKLFLMEIPEYQCSQSSVEIVKTVLSETPLITQGRASESSWVMGLRGRVFLQGLLHGVLAGTRGHVVWDTFTPVLVPSHQE